MGQVPTARARLQLNVPMCPLRGTHVATARHCGQLCLPLWPPTACCEPAPTSHSTCWHVMPWSCHVACLTPPSCRLLGEALQARRSGPTVFLAADPVAEVRSHEAVTANTHQESVNQSNGAGDGAQTGHADLLAEWLPLPQPREPAASTVGSRSPRSSAHGSSPSLSRDHCAPNTYKRAPTHPGSVSGGQGHGRVYHMTRGEVPSGRASATASFAGASSVAHSRSPAIRYAACRRCRGGVCVVHRSLTRPCVVVCMHPSADADRVVQLVQHFVPHAALEDNEGVGVGQGTLEWLYRGLQRSVRRHKSGAGASVRGCCAVLPCAMALVTHAVLVRAPHLFTLRRRLGRGPWRVSVLLC